MPVSKPTLTYFDFPGRAVSARLALFNALGKDGWEDNRINFDTFKEEKKKWNNNGDASAEPNITAGMLKTRMGYVPQLELPSGKAYTQGFCIARYACMLGEGKYAKNLYPVADAELCLAIDEIVNALDEMVNLTLRLTMTFFLD